MENNVQAKNITAIDDYINKVYKIVLLLIPGACEAAGLTFTVLKFLGYLPETVSWTSLIIFVTTCILYLAIGIVLICTGIKDKKVKPGKLKAAKIFIAVLLFIQWNFITYMVPSTDFWGYCFFFVLLSGFFLDWKLTSVCAAEIGISLFVSWFTIGDAVLPVRDNLFVMNMVLRVICIMLGLISIVLLVFLVNRFLVNAKKDEMERNNERVRNVLATVRELSDNLMKAGTALAEISANEAASAEELSSTSERLLSGSNVLMEKARTSTENLNELKTSGAELSENVQRVGETSDEVMKKSSENENMLNSLQEVNKEVITSMEVTNGVAGNLSEAVDGIDDTLKLISDIAMQTNILSINASIEAAHAGEAGKGFSVVAGEVGNLAARTQESLKEIKAVMDNIRENIEAMTEYVGDNNEKLHRQSEYFGNVFGNMSEMNEMLRQTADNIRTMNEVHGRQTEIIGHTVDISSDIAESIEVENKGFHQISAMVDSNAKDAASISQQVEAIKVMAENIGCLLTDSAE